MQQQPQQPNVLFQNQNRNLVSSWNFDAILWALQNVFPPFNSMIEFDPLYFKTSKHTLWAQFQNFMVTLMMRVQRNKLQDEKDGEKKRNKIV